MASVDLAKVLDSEPPLVFGEPATIYVNDDGDIVGNAFFAGEPYADIGQLLSNTDAEFGTGESPDDAILGTEGDDDIWGGLEGDDLIDASAGNDIVGIGDGNVSVATGSGADFVYTVNGGGGNNVLSLGNGVNTVWLENGDYTLTTGSGNDILGLGTGTDTVDAGDGDNIFYLVDSSGATTGDKDILTGAGEDFVETGAGSDRIDAGAGLNTLFGGDGPDLFVVRSGAYNSIGDFEFEIDAIELDELTFSDLSFFQGSGENAADAFVFAGGEAIAEVKNATVAELEDINNFPPV